jgi:hypothetical protein
LEELEIGTKKKEEMNEDRKEHSSPSEKEENRQRQLVVLARAKTPDIATNASLNSETRTNTDVDNKQNEIFGPTLVGRTHPTPQIDSWLKETLRKMPAQNWQVTQNGIERPSENNGGNNQQQATTASFERMAIAPERVEALEGGVLMAVNRIDSDTVDVSMNLHFRAHFGKEELLDQTNARKISDGVENNASGNSSSPRLVELLNTDEELYSSPADLRYAVARYDGNIADGDSRGFLNANNNNSNNELVSTSYNNNAKTALSEEFRVEAKNVRLLERIAVGGFAEVFRGSYQGTLVAVKQLLERGKGVQEKLENEVQTLARLRHPNLLLFMGYSIEPPLILTEFMRRGSLHGILKSDECFKVDGFRCLNIAMAVARGMHYLHSREPPILHLDLKSPNILVDEKWRTKIADFGMSRVRFSTLASARSEFHGTPEWMAPEMLRAEPYDERADIYSYGVVLWELLTTRTPWDELHPMQVVAVVGYSERRLTLPEDWSKRRKELSPPATTSSLSQADELAFSTLTKLFHSSASKKTNLRPKSFESILHTLEMEMTEWRRLLPSSIGATSL